jgi:hypothetical protein
VLNPTEEAQPRFSSEFIPVYKLKTASLAVRAVISAGVPVAVIPPKSILRQHTTNEDYQKFFNDRIRTITQDAIKQEEELFYRPNRWVPGLATGPCLFPYPLQGQVSGYLFNEGQRMIHLVKAALVHLGNRPATPITSSSSSRVQHPRNAKPTLTQTTMKASSGIAGSYQSPASTASVLGKASTYQPTTITLAQLQANRAAVQCSNNFIEYVTSPDLTVGWSDYSATYTEYLNKLGFHTSDERKLKVNDNVVLICDKKLTNYGDKDIMQFAHAQYKVDHISLAGTVVHLHYIGMLNESSEQNTITRHLPAKLTIRVLHEYILLKEQSTADQNSSSSSSGPERGSERLDRNAGNTQPRQRGSTPYSPDDNNEWQNLGNTSRHPPGEADARSEDSEARKHTKSSFLQVGHSRIEVLGKYAVHDHILQTTALRTLQEEGRLQLFLTSDGHGYFGNNYTAQNIIQGLLQYEPVTLNSQLHASLNHARALLLLKLGTSMRNCIKK